MMCIRSLWAAGSMVLTTALTTACGGGSGGAALGQAGPPDAIAFSVTAGAIKTLVFAWADQPGATSYRLFEDIDGSQGAAPETLMADLPAGSSRHETSVYLPTRVNASYRLEACSASGCVTSPTSASTLLIDAVGYFKASTTAVSDQFGQSVALSADGGTLVVGAHLESGVGSGVNTSTDRTGGNGVGAVYVFTKAATGWVQQAYLKPFEADNGDEFGISLALSADGNRLVVGGRGDDSAANGILGVASDNSLPDSGIAHTFERDGAGQWRAGQRLKGWYARAGDHAGFALALSADGRTLAMGAYGDDNEVGGINSVPTHGGRTELSGAVYVFSHDGMQWQPQAYLKAEIPGFDDHFGSALALSATGDTLLVGAPYEAGGLPGVNAPQSDNTAPNAGAVYVFIRDGLGQWRQQAYVKPTVVHADDVFGLAVDLSADGRTAAVGSYAEDGRSIGVAGDPSLLGVSNSGATHVFSLGGAGWTQTAYLKPPKAWVNLYFGASVALSGDGRRLAVGAVDDSSVAGFNGGLEDGGANDSGAAYLFSLSPSGTWVAAGSLKAPHPHAEAFMGWSSIAYSADGESLAIGMSGDHSSATGVQGDQTDRSAHHAGAVLLY